MEVVLFRIEHHYKTVYQHIEKLLNILTSLVTFSLRFEAFKISVV